MDYIRCIVSISNKILFYLNNSMYLRVIRVTHTEVVIRSFVAEHYLSFATANNVVELANEIMRDPSAAKKLKLSCTIASYKLRDGLVKRLQEKLIEKLKKCFFSLNLDKATSLTYHKVFTLGFLLLPP